jgi:hypothetical protein
VKVPIAMTELYELDHDRSMANEGKHAHRGRCIPPLFQLKSKFAVIVTTKDVSQFANVAMLPARPLIFTGSI